MTQPYKIAIIPGDGIGKELCDAVIRVLETLITVANVQFKFTFFDWSSEKYKERGWYMPEDGMAQLRNHDAIFFGAVGWPDVPDHISLWDLILPIRKDMNQYVNLRPIRILPGTESPLRHCEPGDLDWVIVRENSEGEYAGQGGITHAPPFSIATEVSIFTYAGIERVMRFAFETARSRPRKQLTLVTKSNAQRFGLVLWDSVFYDMAKEFPDIHTDKMLVDAMTVRMIRNPKSLDTIVATNLHGDILSDLAAGLCGSIGIAASSNLDPTRKNPSMFEPISGSAPDIAGEGICNPIGAFWSAAEMIKWIGRGQLDYVAQSVVQALESVTVAGTKTRDLRGESGTTEVTEAVCDAIMKASSSK